MRLFIIGLLFLAFSAQGQKKVVIEKFTNSSCGVCPNASLILKDIVSKYDNVIWVSHYKNNGWFENPLTNDQTAQLWSELAVPSNPLGMIDRIPNGNFSFYSSNDWENRITELLEEVVNSEVIIKNVVYDRDNRTISFDTEVVFFEDMPASDYRISAMIVEDDVTGQEQSSYYNEVAGHPLEGRGNLIWDYEHPNVVRAVLDDAWGTQGIIPMSPQADEVYTNSYSYVVPEDYDPTKMKIVAMVNNYEEGNVFNREIFNADQVFLNDLGLQLTSVTSSLVDLGISIYPNPVAEILYIESIDDLAKFSILDVNGRVVQQGELSSENAINVSQLENGTYLLSLQLNADFGVAKFSVFR